ncbi:MAG: hypothetical protein RDV41_15295, partial [Planctomycetota bacterium]|nr:hypothetical protein [Planctomycetota bacterium]
ASCTKQPSAEEDAAEPGKSAAGGKIQAAPLDIPGLGAVDPFGAVNPVFAGPDSGAAGPGAGQGPDTDLGTEPDSGAIASPDAGAENEAVPDEPGEDGLYGGETPEGADPAAIEGLDEEEAALDGPESADEEMDPADWLDDPDVDTTEDPELADPALPEDLDYEPPDMEAWDGMPVDPETPETLESSDDAAGGGGGGLPPMPPAGDSGGYVGVQQRQADWYCTNKPDIGVKFQLPEWLKKLKLAKPGTEAFEKAFQERLAALKAMGMDTSKLEKFRQMLKNHCNRLDSPEELPTFLQSLGLEKPNTQDPAKLKEWREKLANATDSFMLRLLHSDDPALIAAGLKARSGALGKFDEATQEAAEAAIETIKANQKITEDMATLIPYVNIVVSARALYTGESLSGEKLGKIDMLLHTLSLAGPVLKLLRNPALREGAAKLGNKAMWLGEKTIGKLASKMGLSADRLRNALGNLSKATGNGRLKAGENLFGRMWAAEQKFMNTPAGRQAAELARQDMKQAQSLLRNIELARKAGDKAGYRKLITALQGNKTAQGLLNSGKYSNEFRAALDKTHRAMSRLADKRTIGEVMKNAKVQKQIEALAKKLGINPKDIVIKARNVSGNVKTLRNIKPGEMLKYGADR